MKNIEKCLNKLLQKEPMNNFILYIEFNLESMMKFFKTQEYMELPKEKYQTYLDLTGNQGYGMIKN